MRAEKRREINSAETRKTVQHRARDSCSRIQKESKHAHNAVALRYIIMMIPSLIKVSLSVGAACLCIAAGERRKKVQPTAAAMHPQQQRIRQSGAGNYKGMDDMSGSEMLRGAAVCGLHFFPLSLSSSFFFF